MLVLAVSVAACAPVGPASHEEVVTDTRPPVRFTMVNTDLGASEQNAVGVTLVATPDADAQTLLDDGRADLGAANGHGNARSLARALSPISIGRHGQRGATGSTPTPST